MVILAHDRGGCMRYGLNGWHHAEVLAEVFARGFTMLRVGLHTGESASQVQDIQAAGFDPLVIVQNGAQVRLLAEVLTGCDLELWNEPDGTVDGRMVPTEYAALVPAFVLACAEIGATPWIGAISNLHRHGLTWLRQMLTAVPRDLRYGVTIHRYPAGRRWTEAHAGMGSRVGEVEMLRDIIGARPWAVSEFGYHTARQIVHRWLPRRWFYWRWSDEEVAEMVTQEWGFWARQGAEFACLYQLTDGPTDQREDRYGIRRFDGVWKPVVDTVPGQ